MHEKVKNRRPDSKIETIFETEHRLKREAKDIAENFKHVKPVKYLLKR